MRVDQYKPEAQASEHFQTDWFTRLRFGLVFSFVAKNVRSLWFCILLLTIAAFTGCSESDPRTKVTLWHQMTVGERVVLDDCVAQFEEQHPEIRVNAVYKETEELRSGFQAAALAGAGPELVFGPSDSLGTFMAMRIVQDMSPWFEPTLQTEFRTGSLTFLPDENGKPNLVQIGDRVGNHLALVYNRNLIAKPPTTTDEMVAMALSLIHI